MKQSVAAVVQLATKCCMFAAVTGNCCPSLAPPCCLLPSTLPAAACNICKKVLKRSEAAIYLHLHLTSLAVCQKGVKCHSNSRCHSNNSNGNSKRNNSNSCCCRVSATAAAPLLMTTDGVAASRSA